MFLCETAGAAGSDIEDLAVFASQLVALGMPARVAVDSVPENPGRNLQFDLAPHLFDGTLSPGDGLVLLAADQLTDEALPRLRRIVDGAEMSVRAFGCFARPETALGVRARLAYIFGRDPILSDVATADPSFRSPAPAFGVPRKSLPAWHAGEVPGFSSSAQIWRTRCRSRRCWRSRRTAASASRSLPTARTGNVGSPLTDAASRATTTARSCPLTWPSASMSAFSSGALVAAIGCRRSLPTFSFPERRSSMAAPTTGLRMRRMRSLLRPLVS